MIVPPQSRRARTLVGVLISLTCVPAAAPAPLAGQSEGESVFSATCIACLV